MKGPCPNPKHNPNCSKISNRGRLCRSCSKYKGNVKWIECENCKNSFIYRPGYGIRYCSVECYKSDPQTRIKRLKTLQKANTPESREKARKTKESWSEERRQQNLQLRRENRNHITPEYLQKKSKSITDKILSGEFIPHGSHKKGRYISKQGLEEVYHSLWELGRMIELDDLNVEWTKKHGIKIPYFFENLDRLYVPDFLIGSIIEEVKPSTLLSLEVNKVKSDAAKTWCDSTGYTYIINSNIPISYLEKAKQYHEEYSRSEEGI